MSKRKKPTRQQTAADDTQPPASGESATSGEPAPSEIVEQAAAVARDSDRAVLAQQPVREPRSPGDDVETTVNVTGDMLPFPGRDDLDAPTVTVESDALAEIDSLVVQRKHLRGLLEALVFASDAPIKTNELAKLASAPVKQVKELLAELRAEFSTRGFQLEEVAGGWVFRTSVQYAPFIRDLTKQKPVRLSRAQVETLAIIAYRQPITRPEVDDVRGVDSGPVLKVLLERDLVRILGKRDEPGRPIIYGTTTNFLEFFGLKSLKDLPTLREFTELTDESRQKYEDEIGEAPKDAPPPPPSNEPEPASVARPSEPTIADGVAIPTEIDGAELDGDEENGPMTDVHASRIHDDDDHDDGEIDSGSTAEHEVDEPEHDLDRDADD